MGVDWSGMFYPKTPLLEIVVRGTIIYLTLFVLLRVVLKRQAGTMSISDLLLIVLIADAAQNGMSDDYKSVTDGVVLVGVLVFWNYTLDALSYRFRWLRHVVHPAPLLLVRNGRIERKNMKRELITEDELRSQLREQGVEDISTIKAAYIEGDGRVSVIDKKRKTPHGAPEKKSF